MNNTGENTDEEKICNSDVVIRGKHYDKVYAVALKYDEATMHAPKVTISGYGDTATSIIETATGKQVPVRENPTLASALYEQFYEDDFVSKSFFSDIAAILAHVYDSPSQSNLRRCGFQEIINAQPLSPEVLLLELGYGLMPLVDAENSGAFSEQMECIRKKLVLDLGLPVPEICIAHSSELLLHEYCFKIKGTEVGRAKLRPNAYMCIDTGNVTQEIAGDKTVDPAFGMAAIWISEEDCAKAQSAGYAVASLTTIVRVHVTELIKFHAATILGWREVRKIIDSATEYSSELTEFLLSNMDIVAIHAVLCGLLREQVSIRNFIDIFEKLAAIAKSTRNTGLRIEKVRQALGRQICMQHADDSHILHTVTICPDFLNTLLEASDDTSDTIGLPPEARWSFVAAVSAAFEQAIDKKGFTPVILCPESTRILVRRALARELPNLAVLSAPEIPDDIKVELLGEIQVHLDSPAVATKEKSVKKNIKSVSHLELTLTLPEADIKGLHFNEKKVKAVFEQKDDGCYYSRNVLFHSARRAKFEETEDVLTEYLETIEFSTAIFDTLPQALKPAAASCIRVFIPEKEGDRDEDYEIKHYNGGYGNYWLRQPFDDSFFFVVYSDGHAYLNKASSSGGCAPAFRIEDQH
ncbi:MAG: hypothetical protein Ta2A_12770 [Treponemataceae bacterium]|nr:MAG: hypothetical protein Ta2A_12770 [Treponemataceae bacterium]